MFFSQAEKNGFTVNFSAEFAGIDKIADMVESFLDERGLQKLFFGICLGMREALTNAIRHGSQLDTARNVFFGIEYLEDEVVIKVSDQGEGFDWRKAREKCASVTEGSGRGLCIMNQYFDSVAYPGNGNEVILRKKCHAIGAGD